MANEEEAGASDESLGGDYEDFLPSNNDGLDTLAEDEEVSAIRKCPSHLACSRLVSTEYCIADREIN